MNSGTVDASGFCALPWWRLCVERGEGARGRRGRSRRYEVDRRAVARRSEEPARRAARGEDVQEGGGRRVRGAVRVWGAGGRRAAMVGRDSRSESAARLWAPRHE
ncbi:hypothetical protein K1T71_006500 [Dendrolimus kikuchii]|uniref:Uncharacterized protein n=1 Tax=Dendrolimus kikuchii TaxID=765133 RepID=A0ACC1D261_9NEOP|nr:hypothetical protein K1T71_006500 [Dendrolimus kikuchii]